jgi:hypothetical protein
MQMKKNYLLLFFIALLFGIGTLPGRADGNSGIDVNLEYHFKIGNGYIKKNGASFDCVADKSQATVMKFSAMSSGTSVKFGPYINNKYTAIRYDKKGKFSIIGNDTFEYVTISGKHYLKATAYDLGYLTNENGKLVFKPTATPNAVFEFENKNGDNSAAVAKGKELMKTFAMFQCMQHSETGVGVIRNQSPLVGNGLGQYPLPTFKDWKYTTDNMFLDVHTNFAPATVDSDIRNLEGAINALKITPVTSGYVYITTKSKYEQAIRDTTSGAGHSQLPVNDQLVGPSQSAQYLMASAEGYKLTDDKSKAAVFYFDGQHLTGIDNGFGLGTPSYTQTENDQKAVIAQGKLEKTLDAGSYSLKVGDKFVKLDRTNGLSLSTSESDSHLFLEEATKFTLNTDDLGYISFFAPTAVKVPAGVEVYSGNINAQNSVITFNKVNTQQIPANTAVLLRKVTGKGSFEVEKIASTTSTIGNNSLKGYTVSSSDHLSNAYGLTVENNKLVFKPLTQGVRAFRAVIYNNNAAGAPAYYPTAFTPEGIHGVTVDDNQAEVFDLAGRRVEAPVKGQVYVKNGKKFIQK